VSLDFRVADLCKLGFTVCGSYPGAGLATPVIRIGLGIFSK